MTGDADEIISYKQTVKLHELATSARFNELVVIPGGNHFTSYLKKPKIYLNKLEAFLNKCSIELQPVD